MNETADTTLSALDRAARIIEPIDDADRPEIWISRVTTEALALAITELDERRAAGASLPLDGLTFAVKDNIDVAGVPTTAGCPAFASTPTVSAPSVAALVQAGALFVGKTNLDQFATGLVGTRSPYGAVRNAVDPSRISGGSSSGSAVAVALELVDLALGTDTAGSGRVPAALNGIVGIKPTYGVVSTAGVVPACRSFDCVSVFALDVSTARRAVAVMADTDPSDPRRRRRPSDAPLGLPSSPIVAVVDDSELVDLSPERLVSYRRAVDRLVESGVVIQRVSLAPFLAAGSLLYGGAFVTERADAVGDFVATHQDDVDPVVGSIVTAAGALSGPALAGDLDRLHLLRTEVDELFASTGACSLLLPTTGRHPTIEDVAADPLEENAAMGRYTTFVNLLDQCAVSVPAEPVAGLPFGVSVIGPAFTDLIQADLAEILEGVSMEMARMPRDDFALPAIEIAVAGAHLTGQPLNSQLTDRGARLVSVTTTAATYALFALDTNPPKPGLVRVGAGGAAIEVEVWRVPPVGFASFVAALPPPMTVGPVSLADGSVVTGFGCEPIALEGAEDITSFGGWRSFLAR